jgi:hypothetical protein
MLTVTQPVKNFLEKMYAEPYMGIGHKTRKDSALVMVSFTSSRKEPGKKKKKKKKV